MKKRTIITMAGIIVFSLSTIVAKSASNETESFNQSLLIKEKDPCLNIEDWMLESQLWNDEKDLVKPTSDKELKLESWMLKSNIWGNL